MAIYHDCKYCGKSFKHRPGRKHQFNKFCSRPCSGLDSALHFNKEKSPHWKREMIREKSCLYCGRKIKHVERKDLKNFRSIFPDTTFTTRAISKFQDQKFCSSKCAQVGKSYKKKEQHWNWRGGIGGLRHLIMSSGKYKRWRKVIFERDNYTCQKCGKHGGNLEADHKKQFVLILIENNIKTVDQALECDDLWKISNGRTLCQKCHRKTFVFFGNQFIAYRKNGVNSGKPRTGNPEPSQEIASRLLEGVETRLNKYNAINAPPKGKI